METHLNKGRLLLALGCICSLTHIAYAAENNDIEEIVLVVVTPTKTKTSLSDAPAAVTVVTDKDIKAKNASRLGDVLDQVPSLYLRGGALGQSQGTIGTSGMSLRGVDQSRTLILLDGQPIQDASSGKANWRIPFVEDIARVEVVPGAFSSLYGSNAIGGVVNIISKQPDRREFTTRLKKGYGDASGEDASVYVREKLDNGLGIVAGLGYQNRDSYVNEFVVKTPSATCGGTCTPVSGARPITTRDGTPAYLVGDMGKVPWNAANATAKLFYDLSATDKIYTGIVYQETNLHQTQFNTYLRNTATGSPVSSGWLDINGQFVNLTNFDFTLGSSLPLHESATQYFAGYDGKIGEGYSLKIDLAKIKRAYTFTFADPTATWYSGPGNFYDTPNTGLDGTAQLSFSVGLRQVLVTGLALHKDSVHQKIYALSNWRDPGTQTSLGNYYNGDSTTTSIFAQDEISAADGLTIYLGGRLDKWQTKGDNFNTVATVYPKRSVSAFSPKLSVVYLPTEAATLRVSLGRSFRAPANQDLYTSSTTRSRTTTGDPNLQPERGTTWEVGGEFRTSDSFKVLATYYETQLTNLIYVMQVTTVPPPNISQSQRINAGKARIRGMELGASSNLTEWLALDANYAYIDSVMLENTTDPLSVGKRLTDSPKNIAGIELTAKQGSWSGALSARYVSHSFFTAQNTDVFEGVPGSYDAYTIVNSKLGYEFAKEIKGTIAINNLLDKKAYSYFLMPRRNVTAEMDFSF